MDNLRFATVAPPRTPERSHRRPVVPRRSIPGVSPSNRSGEHPQSSRSATGITVHFVPESASVLLRNAHFRRYWVIPAPQKRWIQISRARPARAARRSMISRAVACVIVLVRRASLLARGGNAALGPVGRGEERHRGEGLRSPRESGETGSPQCVQVAQGWCSWGAV